MPARHLDADGNEIDLNLGPEISAKAIRRLDYTPPPFCVPDVIFDVRISPGVTTVYGLLQIYANPDAAPTAKDLLLDCEEAIEVKLTIKKISQNARVLDHDLHC